MKLLREIEEIKYRVAKAAAGSKKPQPAPPEVGLLGSPQGSIPTEKQSSTAADSCGALALSPSCVTGPQISASGHPGINSPSKCRSKFSVPVTKRGQTHYFNAHTPLVST